MTIKGDVPATGRLLITEGSGHDQGWLIWGIQSRYVDTSANGALFYEAEGRTGLNGAAAAAGIAGASGSGSNVMRSAALTPSWVGVLSTQATGGGAHLAHVGDFNVWARVNARAGTAGTVKVRLSWSTGDFRSWATNGEAVISDVIGAYRLVDLGQVHLSKAASGTQQWQGRIEARSTVTGDTVDVDCLLLIPTSEGSGRVRARQQFETPTLFVARDEFNQAAGALAGKTLPVGGTWSSSSLGGGGSDFLVNGVGTAYRAAVSDTYGAGQVARASGTNLTATVAQVDYGATGLAFNDWATLTARYVDGNNYLLAGVGFNDYAYPLVVKVVGGTPTIITGLTRPGGMPGINLPVNPATNNVTMRVLVDPAGRWYLWIFNTGTTPSAPVAQGYDADLATGGALASGYTGLYDQHPDAAASTRTFDNFFAAVPSVDAALFANRQLEIRSDQVRRQDSTGAIWSPKTMEGDYLKIPPSGREGRTTRIIVKASRNDPATMPDPAIDTITGQVFYVPRFLSVPEP